MRTKLVLLGIVFLLISTAVSAVSMFNNSGTFIEDFESEEFTTNGWSAESPWEISPTDVYAGAFAARLRNGGTAKNLSLGVDTSNYVNITILYYRKLVAPQPVTFEARWFDGSTWTTLETTSSVPSWASAEFNLPPSAYNNPNFEVGFSCTSSNSGSSCYIDNVIISGAVNDSQFPTWSNLTTPTNPSTYDPAGIYIFTVDWIDDVGMDKVKLEFDGVNTTATNVGNTYSVIFGPLGAGVHNFKWYGRDKKLNTNNTGPLTFTVNKASTTTQVYLNGAVNDTTIEYLSPANASATTSSGSLSFTRDGSSVSNPDMTMLDVGIYNYTAANSGNENYTASASSLILTVVDTTAPGNVTNLTLFSYTNTTATWTWNNPTDPDFAYINVYINGASQITTNGTNFTATNLLPDQNYTLTLVGFDIRGNNRTIGTDTINLALMNVREAVVKASGEKRLMPVFENFP